MSRSMARAAGSFGIPKARPPPFRIRRSGWGRDRNCSPIAAWNVGLICRSSSVLAYLCSNCRALIAHDGRGGRSVVEATFAEIDDARGYAWYPFWMFAGPEEILVPAFSIRNYRDLVKFGAIMSGRERRYRPSRSGMRSASGVSLPVDVAAGLAGLIAERRYGLRHAFRASVSESPVAGTSVPDSRLVFLPLKRAGAELHDPVTELCLSCSALAPA